MFQHLGKRSKASATLIAFILLLTVVIPAAAVQFGEPDGDGHPHPQALLASHLAVARADALIGPVVVGSHRAAGGHGVPAQAARRLDHDPLVTADPHPVTDDHGLGPGLAQPDEGEVRPAQVLGGLHALLQDGGQVAGGVDGAGQLRHPLGFPPPAGARSPPDAATGRAWRASPAGSPR